MWNFKIYLTTFLMMNCLCSYAQLNFVNNEVLEDSSSYKLTFDRSLGNTSAAISQFKTYSDRKLFVGREEHPRSKGRFSLAIFRMQSRANNSVHLVKQKTLLNTSSRLPRIHGGNFQISTAYDPYIEWHEGEHWVAFECHGPTFNSLAANMRLSKSSVGICLGPLNKNNDLILSRTRVVLAGGSARGSYVTKSASVPKLLSDDGKLYLYWTSVAKDRRASYIRSRANASEYYKYKNRDIDSSDNAYRSHRQYKDLTYTSNGIVYPYTYAQYNPPKSSRCLQVSYYSNCALSKSAFLTLQRNTLNRFSPYSKWVTSNGQNIKRGYKRSTEVLQFKKLRSFGSELKFKNGTKGKFAYLQQGLRKYHAIALAHEYSRFTEVLGVLNNGDNPSQSVVADMFEIKKIGDYFYYLFALGGRNSEDSKYYNYHCTSATVGSSDIGCYRFAAYRSKSPLTNLRNENVFESEYFGDNLTYENTFASGDKASVSYPRFFVHPGTLRTMISTNFTKFNAVEGQYGKVLLVGSHSLGHAHIKNKLNENEELNPGEILLSNNGKYGLELLNNSWVIKNYHTNRTIFSKRFNSIRKLKLQSNGQIVAFSSSRRQPTWSTGRVSGTTILILQDDGNLVQYKMSGSRRIRALWSSKNN